jgi:hypothetical protein
VLLCGGAGLFFCRRRQKPRYVLDPYIPPADLTFPPDKEPEKVIVPVEWVDPVPPAETLEEDSGGRLGRQYTTRTTPVQVEPTVAADTSGNLGRRYE